MSTQPRGVSHESILARIRLTPPYLIAQVSDVELAQEKEWLNLHDISYEAQISRGHTVLVTIKKEATK